MEAETRVGQSGGCCSCFLGMADPAVRHPRRHHGHVTYLDPNPGAVPPEQHHLHSAHGHSRVLVGRRMEVMVGVKCPGSANCRAGRCCRSAPAPRALLRRNGALMDQEGKASVVQHSHRPVDQLLWRSVENVDDSRDICRSRMPVYDGDASKWPEPDVSPPADCLESPARVAHLRIVVMHL